MAEHLFDTYLFVDWSARSTPSPAEPCADAIWSAELTAGRAPTVSYLRTRESAFHHVEARLLRAVGEGRRVLIGCDFPYGYPKGFAGSLRRSPSPDWRHVWELLVAEVFDAADNVNNRFEVANRLNDRVSRGCPGPFWGHPAGRCFDALAATSPGFPYPCGTGAELARIRACEARLPGTQETWKLLGVGSVGSQALTGIPRMFALRFHETLGRYSEVWPFETGFTPRPTGKAGPQIVHTEVWPGIVKAEVKERLLADPGAVKDQVQVTTLCRWASELDGAGELGKCFDVPAGLTPDQLEGCVREEGWVLGA